MPIRLDRRRHVEDFIAFVLACTFSVSIISLLHLYLRVFKLLITKQEECGQHLQEVYGFMGFTLFLDKNLSQSFSVHRSDVTRTNIREYFCSVDISEFD